jgi:hypothetical protein
LSRHPTPTRSAQIEALLSGPLIFDIAARLDEIPRRKRRNHPTALHLAYGALARLHHSQNRLDAELATTSAWHHLLEIYNTGAAAHPAGESVPPRYRKLTTDSYRSFRNWICDDPYNLAALQDAFTQASVAAAQTIGLLDPNGPGSITRPPPPPPRDRGRPHAPTPPAPSTATAPSSAPSTAKAPPAPASTTTPPATPATTAPSPATTSSTSRSAAPNTTAASSSASTAPPAPASKPAPPSN